MEKVATRGDGVGMILGKFLPPHAGHEHLVHFGRNFSHELYVLVCSLNSDSIPGPVRYGWLCELFPDVHVCHIDQPLPQCPEEHPDFWRIWRDVVQQAVGRRIDYVFASEDYGVRLAAELSAKYIPVDPHRSRFPVSGTAVRERPLAHWELLPECVRAYFVRRVCVFGPESTGKTTLAHNLARHFQTLWAPEFARPWLDPRQGVCRLEDIPIIARGQAALEDALARRANRVLICDTDLLLTTIWSQVLFQQCPTWIEEQALQRRYDLYLLLDVDVPWVDDNQRYLPQRRGEFFDLCLRRLQDHQRPYVILSGDWSRRWECACRAVQSLLD